MPKVVYLTGAPASGKSSLANLLVANLPGLLVWEYGARLLAHVNAKYGAGLAHDALRAQSARIVTHQDIEEVDRLLIEFVASNRDRANIIIDSHPVTKEQYGYRVTSFPSNHLIAIGLDEIWVLYTSPEEACKRIEAAAGGRPTITQEEARLHTFIQGAVASSYGILAGCPVYFFDSSFDNNVLSQMLTERLS